MDERELTGQDGPLDDELQCTLLQLILLNLPNLQTLELPDDFQYLHHLPAGSLPSLKTLVLRPESGNPFQDDAFTLPRHLRVGPGDMLWKLPSAAPHLEHLTLRKFWSRARDRFPTLRNLLSLKFCDSMLEGPSVLRSLGCVSLQRFTYDSTGFVDTRESWPEDAEYEQDEEDGELVFSENAQDFINHLRPYRFSLKHIDLAMRSVEPDSRIASLKGFEACETLSLSSNMIRQPTSGGTFVDVLPQSIRKFELSIPAPGVTGHLLPLARYLRGLPKLERAIFSWSDHRSCPMPVELERVWIDMTVTLQPGKSIKYSDPGIFNQHIEQSSITEAGKTYLREEVMPLFLAFQAEGISTTFSYYEAFYSPPKPGEPGCGKTVNTKFTLDGLLKHF